MSQPYITIIEAILRSEGIEADAKEVKRILEIRLGHSVGCFSLISVIDRVKEVGREIVSSQ